MESAVDLLLNIKNCQIQREEDFAKRRDLESLDKEERKFKETLANIQNNKEKKDVVEDKDILEKELEEVVKKLAKDRDMDSSEAEKLLIKMFQILKKNKLSLSKILEKLKIKKEDLLGILENYKGLLKLDKTVAELKELIEMNKMINENDKKLAKNDSKANIQNNKEKKDVVEDKDI
ncbi:MAG: hypothetical protein QMD92_07760, partial [bacterium]|nr:hypothetical protein [bacterium]